MLLDAKLRSVEQRIYEIEQMQLEEHLDISSALHLGQEELRKIIKDLTEKLAIVDRLVKTVKNLNPRTNRMQGSNANPQVRENDINHLDLVKGKGFFNQSANRYMQWRGPAPDCQPLAHRHWDWGTTRTPGLLVAAMVLPALQMKARLRLTELLFLIIIPDGWTALMPEVSNSALSTLKLCSV
ncbi:hypothetical protein ACJJTC_017844 [Scirpophaga incertulas]